MTVKQASSMKVVCDRDALVDAMGLVTGVIAGRTPTPVLQCVRLSAADGRLSLAATDQEVSLSLALQQVDLEADGEALIPADKFSQIARSCQDATLTLSEDGDALHVRSSDSRFKVFGFPIADAPEIQDTSEEGPSFTISAASLHGLVERTIFAAATDHSRYAINGVLLHQSDNDLRMVATNGHRLAVATGSCEGGSGERNCIVPVKAMTLLRRLLTDGDATVSVTLEEGRVVFRIEDEAGGVSVLTSNLVEGTFPPFEDVIPKDLDRKVTLSTDALERGIRRAALLTSEDSRGVRMVFGDGRLLVTSRSPEMGEAEVEIPLDGFDGEPLEIGFNPAYIVDALKVVGADEITFEMKRGDKPGVFRVGSDFVYVIMPVSLT